MTVPTRVVNVRAGTPFDVYVGRANGRYRLPASPWANPFKVGRDGTPDEVIARYRAWLDARPELLARLPELRGRTLACWCRPPEGFGGRVLCHAQVLAGLADGVAAEAVD